MSRSTVDASEQQTAKHSPDREVSHVRSELERLMEDAVGVEDADSLIGVAEEMGQYLIFLQEKEKNLLPVISSARVAYSSMLDMIKTYEDSRAIDLNNNGFPMNRAEKMARLETSVSGKDGEKPLRERLNEVLENRLRLEDEYTDLKGFRNVVEACKMTVHQKVKMLYSEYKATPFQVERNQ